jgi:hypothetical protein
MTPTEIIAQARRILDDEEVPLLWQSLELVGYLNDAINQMCEQLHPIQDDTTALICNLALTAALGQDYVLSPLIVEVETVRLTGVYLPLQKTSRKFLDSYIPGWRSHTGQPQYYCTDYKDGYISFDKKPLAPTTYAATMLVSRYMALPVTVTDLDHALELPARYHFGLADGVCARAYLKQDAECTDKEKAATHTELFGAFIERMKVQKRNREHFEHVLGPHPGTI